jgi:uncharacterized membrane protein YkvA (DUF1232 family)
LLEHLKTAARALKRETVALYLAARDPRTPWLARLMVAIVVAYALSPIDLIPDFIPVLGYLDDLILLPLGIWLALKLIPEQVMADARARAAQAQSPLPRSLAAAAVVIALWIAAGMFLVALAVLALRSCLK